MTRDAFGGWIFAVCVHSCGAAASNRLPYLLEIYSLHALCLNNLSLFFFLERPLPT